MSAPTSFRRPPPAGRTRIPPRLLLHVLLLAAPWPSVWRGKGKCVGVCAHPHFTLLLPNGNNVFHEGRLIAAVGHTDPRGHGPLNAFGRDFAANELTWTPDLCARDSDGDGLSNGVELGDPLCVWSRGGGSGGDSSAPKGSAFDALGPSDRPFHFGLVLTHPGVANHAAGRDRQSAQRQQQQPFASLRPTEVRHALNIRRELRTRTERELQTATRTDSDPLVEVVLIVSCDREDAERVARALRNDSHFSGRVVTTTPVGVASSLSAMAASDADATPLTLVVRVVSAATTLTPPYGLGGDAAGRLSLARRCAVDLANNNTMLPGLGWHSAVVVFTDAWGPNVAALWIRHLVASERQHCAGSDNNGADSGLGLGFCAAEDSFGGVGVYDDEGEEDEDFDEDLGGEDFDDDAFEEE